MQTNNLNCPQCGSTEVSEADEGRWATCEDCGFVQYDAETLQLMAEVQREQKVCKQVLGYVPTYGGAIKEGLAR